MPNHTATQTKTCDFLVIGAGIAGASIAYYLAPHGRTVVLERETQPGYHSTGRSAAQYILGYGPEQVRRLTKASFSFFSKPPADFADVALLQERGVLTFACHGQEALLENAWQSLQSVTQKGQLLDAQAACALVPVLRKELLSGAVYDADSYDINVHALHQGFLNGVRRNAGTILTSAEVLALHIEKDGWRVHTKEDSFFCKVLINAAGAWCDSVAQLGQVAPIGLIPKRRSAFTFAAPKDLTTQHWPLTLAADESCYFKPDAGALLGSPANADPTWAQDVQAEELDLALGVHYLEQYTHMQVHPKHVWAGLRSFVADGGLVGGYDSVMPNFFWCAGQGGYGIQTSPAMGQACAALILQQALPPAFGDLGLDAKALSPKRLPVLAPKD